MEQINNTNKTDDYITMMICTYIKQLLITINEEILHNIQ